MHERERRRERRRELVLNRMTSDVTHDAMLVRLVQDGCGIRDSSMDTGYW